MGKSSASSNVERLLMSRMRPQPPPILDPALFWPQQYRIYSSRPITFCAWSALWWAGALREATRMLSREPKLMIIPCLLHSTAVLWTHHISLTILRGVEMCFGTQ